MKRDELAAMTKKDLAELARKAGIEGRSALSKGELIRALMKGAPPQAPQRAPEDRKPGRARARKQEGAMPPAPRREPPAAASPEARPRSTDPHNAPSPGQPRAHAPAPPAHTHDLDEDLSERQPPELARRGGFGEDPGMKLSRVEEIRKAMPGRRHGSRHHGEADPRARGSVSRGGPHGRGDRRGPGSFGRQGPEQPGGLHAGRRRDRGRDRDRGPIQDQHRDRERHGDRDQSRPREHGRDRDQGRDRDPNRPADRFGRFDDRRGGGRRFERRDDRRDGRRDDRAGRAREGLRQSGDARRRSPYTPQYEPEREAHRTARPPTGPPREHTFTGPQRPRGGGAERMETAPTRLPETYGRDRCVLMARDPYWLHAYWEVTPATIARAKENLGAEGEGHRWVLRMHSYEDPSSDRGMEIFDVDLEPNARNWYIRVPHPDRSYRATIGLRTRAGALYPFARSGRITTPRAAVSGMDDPGAVAAADEDLRILTLSGMEQAAPSSPGPAASAGAFGAQPAREIPTSPGVPGAQSGAGPTPGVDAVPGSGPAGGAVEGVSSLTGAEGPAAPASALDAIRLDIRTDLILFGSTHPDARLTVQDRAVGVRPDGTFSVRVELPDGEQTIPCVARTADGRVARVTAAIQRTTIPDPPESAVPPRPEAWSG